MALKRKSPYNGKKISLEFEKRIAQASIVACATTLLAFSAYEDSHFLLFQSCHLYRMDSYFENTQDAELLANKLIEAVEKNSNIQPDELESFYALRQYLEDNTYIDYADVYQRFRTLHIEETKTRSMLSDRIILAQYFRHQNKCVIYLDGLLRKQDILPHELIHITGELPEYPMLAEGVTELLYQEYCQEGQIRATYWEPVNCIKMLCEIVDPQIVLQAYSEYNSKPIIDALTNLCGDRILAMNLLEEMNSYCYDNIYADQKEIDRVQRWEQLSTLLTSFVDTYKCDSKDMIDTYMEMLKTYAENKQSWRLYSNNDYPTYFYKKTATLDASHQKVLYKEKVH